MKVVRHDMLKVRGLGDDQPGFLHYRVRLSLDKQQPNPIITVFLCCNIAFLQQEQQGVSTCTNGSEDLAGPVIHMGQNILKGMYPSFLLCSCMPYPSFTVGKSPVSNTRNIPFLYKERSIHLSDTRRAGRLSLFETGQHPGYNR